MVCRAMAIELIDIFNQDYRQNGLPDLSKLRIGHIFNASVAARANEFEYKFAPPEQEKPKPVYDPRTMQEVQSRKATVVEDILDGGLPRQRGVRAGGGPVRRSNTGGYSEPNYPEPDLPSEKTVGGDSLLPPAGGPPEPEKRLSPYALPDTILEELKSLGML